MSIHFSVQSIEGDEAVLVATDGTIVRCPKSLFPGGAVAGADVWLTTDRPADPQAILNEALGTNHGPSNVA